MNFKLWLETDGMYLRGEYWIQEGGHAVYADGDLTHEGIAVQAVIHEIMGMFDVYNDDEYVDWDEVSQDILKAIKDDFDDEEREKYKWLTGHTSEDYDLIVDKMKEMGDPNADEKIRVLYGTTDAREYALKHWGWKTVRENDIETWTLTPSDMRTIADGIHEIEYEISEDAEFHISVYGQSRNFTITMRELVAGRIGGAAAPSLVGRKISQWNTALTQNATVQNREEDIKKLHPAYQKLAFPLGDATMHTDEEDYDESTHDVEVSRPEIRNSSFEDEVNFHLGNNVLRMVKNKFAPTDWSVTETFVDEALRRQGIASLLIDKMLATLHGTIGAQCSNDGSVQLFWKKGFRIDGTLDDAIAKRREWSSVNLIHSS